MRILLTNAPLQYYHASAFYHSDWGALNLAQLAAMVDTPENQIKILDNMHFWFKPEEIIKTVEEFKPDLLGINNCTDRDTESILERVRIIKKKNPKIILVGGGQAATFKFDYLLNQGFDIIVLGEGEVTFQELVAALTDKKDDFRRIKGIAYKMDGQIIKTEPRPFLKNLDDLPFPARKYQRRLKSIFFPGRYSSEIETARGCPYACHFCAVTAFWRRTFRKKSNERIMQELREIKYKYGATQVYFIDDVFGIKANEYMELFKMMLDENLAIKWYTQIRPDTIADNPKMIELAARAGMFSALVGFEAYDEKVLKNVGKIGSAEINTRAAGIFRKNKIIILGAHMFNLPEQSLRDYYLTCKYGSRYSDVFYPFMFSPVLWTPIFEKLKKEGKVRLCNTRNPYAYYIVDEGINYKKIKLVYMWYLFLYYFNPRTIISSFLNKDRLLRKMKIQNYIHNFRYIFYIFCRKIGIKIL